MSITLHWWALPVVIVVIGYLVAQVYFSRNYQPGGYFGDFVTPVIALGLFLVFAAIALGIVVGKFLS